MQSIVSTSPDNKHNAVLEYLNEVRFGPSYYSLTVDKISFGQRIFGNSYVWSPDSRYLAIQEWETISEERGPQTQLLLIDVESERECVLSRAKRGFIVPKKFEKDKLIYVKKYFVPRTATEFEIEFLTSNRWEDLNIQGNL
jgi:hypothetical protein